MDNFIYHVPTKIHFGRDQLSNLSELRESGDKVLLVCGGSSIRRSGLYDAVCERLAEAGLEMYELSGVEPNPRVETVRKGVSLCRENRIDMVLGVGGGSVIDCSKMIAAGALYDSDVWDLVEDGSKIRRALPIYAVLTLAATGSEMDGLAVISDMGKNKKVVTRSQVLRPVMSILDPTYSETVSRRQTVSGAADILSHLMETYFNNAPEAYLQKRMCEAVMDTVIRFAPVAAQRPDDYEARANLMWASSLAINGLLSAGCSIVWSVHPIEHELSAFYDVTHGEGLAVLTPAWMRWAMRKAPDKIPDFAMYARNVWGVGERDDALAAEQGVRSLETFLYQTLGVPASLRALGISEKKNFQAMAKSAARPAGYVPMLADDVLMILEECY